MVPIEQFVSTDHEDDSKLMLAFTAGGLYGIRDFMSGKANDRYGKHNDLFSLCLLIIIYRRGAQV